MKILPVAFAILLSTACAHASSANVETEREELLERQNTFLAALAEGVSTGTVTNTFQGEDGPVEYAGKYLLGRENRDGDWKIVIYSVSNNRSDQGR